MLKNSFKQLNLILGLIFLILAIIGIVLPLLPTTPFVLLALYFFGKSSPVFYKWCLNLPMFGEGISDWQDHKIISRKAKIQASALLGISAIFIVYQQNITLWLKLIVLGILLSVMTFLLTRRSAVHKDSSVEAKNKI